MTTEVAIQAMSYRPPPPPEATLIRLVRMAAGLKVPAVAKAAGISKARWSQVEVGYESRLGGYKAVRARADTLAHMAHAVGLGPERLAAEGGRPDAAEILREILRQDGDDRREPERQRGDSTADLIRSINPDRPMTTAEREALKKAFGDFLDAADRKANGGQDRRRA